MTPDARPMPLGGPRLASDVEADPPRAGVDPGRLRPGQRIRRGVGLGAVGLALVLAGCGASEGSGSKNSTSNGESGSSVAAGEGASEAATAQGGTGKGMIEIGDQRHELTVTRCTPSFGTIGGAAESVTEPDNVNVYFELPPNDWTESKTIEMLGHSGLVRLNIEDTYLEWVTSAQDVEDLNLPNGLDAADVAITELDVSKDGQTIEGKATFLQVNRMSADGGAAAEAGTFSFSCPPAD